MNEAGLTVNGAEPSQGEMLDGSFHHDDDEIINEATPNPIAVAIDDQEPAAGPQDAVHFRHHQVLAGIMMEAVGAGNRVEAVIREGRLLAVGLHELESAARGLQALAALAQHAVAEIEAPDPRFADARPASVPRKPPCRSRCPGCRFRLDESCQEHLVGRPEEDVLQEAAVVTLAPAIELPLRFRYCISHRSHPCHGFLEAANQILV